MRSADRLCQTLFDLIRIDPHAVVVTCVEMHAGLHHGSAGHTFEPHVLPFVVQIPAQDIRSYHNLASFGSGAAFLCVAFIARRVRHHLLPGSPAEHRVRENQQRSINNLYCHTSVN
jgi:hypothetical protein